MIPYRMFLDDERDPPNDGEPWVTVRTVPEARSYIEAHGTPEFVSFDHDLGKGEEDGIKLASHLIDLDMDSNLKLLDGFQWYVHSQNPPGRENINGLLENYMNLRQRTKLDNTCVI